MNAASGVATRLPVGRIGALLTPLFALALGLCTMPAAAQDKKKEDKKEVKKDDKKDDKKEAKKKDEPALSLKGHKDWVNRLSFRADGKQMLSASRDKTVRIWDAATGKELMLIKDFPTNVKNALFSPDGKSVLATTGQWHKKEQQWIGEIRISDAATGKLVKTLKGHSETIESADVSRDGKYLATGSEDRSAKIWDLATGKELHTLKGHRGPVLAVAFRGDGARLATAGDIVETKKIDDKPKKDDKKKKDKKDKKDDKKPVDPKEVKEPQGPGAEIKIWDTASGKEIRTLTGPTRSITCLTFSHDGKRIAAGSLDGTIRVWDAETGKELLLLKGHEGVWSIAFGADGSKLATSGWDETIRIWDAASGKELRSIYGHDRTVTTIAFSPDGQRLASGGIDQIIRVWSLGTRKN